MGIRSGDPRPGVIGCRTLGPRPRKLVLMGSDSVARADFAPLTQPDSGSESEIGSQVDVGVLEELGGEVDVLAARVEISVLELRAALATLDTIDLEEVFLHTSLHHEKSSCICERSVQSSYEGRF